MLKPASKRKTRRTRRRAAANLPPLSVISLRVDTAVKESLERYAHRSRRSLSEVLREAIECWSARHEVPLAADAARGAELAPGAGLNA